MFVLGVACGGYRMMLLCFTCVWVIALNFSVLAFEETGLVGVLWYGFGVDVAFVLILGCRL